jgi:hypothetical protein
VIFELKFSDTAEQQLNMLERSPDLAKRFKAVRKALGLLERNPRHPGLQEHECSTLKGPDGAKVFEASAELSAPAPDRIFWCYGPAHAQMITIVAITPHHP